MTRWGDNAASEKARRQEAAARTDAVRRNGQQRRGVALVVVVALLGILFVIGVVFMRSMRFETQNIQVQHKQVNSNSAIGTILEITAGALVNGVRGSDGIPYSTNQVVDLVDGNGPIQPTYGEVLGIHSLVGQMDPELSNPGQSSLQQPMVYLMPGDAIGAATRRGFRIPPDGSSFDGVVITAPFGDSDRDGVPDWRMTYGEPDDWGDLYPQDGMRDVVDADGDGINDSIQYPLSTLKLAPDQVRSLKSTVNDPLNAEGEPGVAIRVVDHGAMVNLNYAHPEMINTILSNDYRGRSIDWESPLSRSYVPDIEEPVLRRRGMLPPRELPPTRLTGNPFVLDSGELTSKLLVQYPLMQSGQWRWWTLRFDEDFDGSGDAWLYNVMMTRGTVTTPGRGAYYDRRRLLTTVSHDDLLSRGYAQSAGGRTLNIVTLMTERYQAARRSGASPREQSALPFLRLCQYPCVDFRTSNQRPSSYLGVAYDRGDDSPDVPSCIDFDGDGMTEGWLSGRLMLSLPWIEQTLLYDMNDDQQRTTDDNGINALDRHLNTVKAQQAIALVQAQFTIMLLNAERSELFKDPVKYLTYEAARELRDFDGDGDTDKFDLISLLAASMTANLFDFADQDAAHVYQDANGRWRPNYEDFNYEDRSTIVALRVSDPTSPEFGQVIEARDMTGNPLDIPEVVYGLERQPYITEIVALAYTSPPSGRSAYAVELFSPYRDALFDLSRYGIYVRKPNTEFINIDMGNPTFWRIDTNGPVFLPLPSDLANYAVQDRPPGYFIVLEGDSNAEALLYGECLSSKPANRVVIGDRNRPFEFDNGDTIYLVRFDQGYQGTFHPVDQFLVNGSNIAIREAYPGDQNQYENGYSMERRMVRSSDLSDGLDDGDRARGRWMAPVSLAAEFDAWNNDTDACLHSLGATNVQLTDNDTDPRDSVRNVEVEFADSGSLEESFPTTGSLLFLMRWANERTGAFTRLLQSEAQTIDNGRLPVFDNGIPGSDQQGDPILVPLHHVDAKSGDAPGGLAQLPWGQYVFDYFTALPLGTSGDPDHERPLVDMGGYRVSGRLNLNTAPWPVLAGLPVTPAARMPLPYYFEPYESNGKIAWDWRGEVRDALQWPLLTDAERQTGRTLDEYRTYPIGYRLAKAAVAYVQATQLTEDLNGDGSADEWSGAYNDDRSWINPDSALFRCGTGIMSVGELLNVRSPGAVRMPNGALPDTGYSSYRFDLGVNGRRGDVNGDGEPDVVLEDYAQAVALMASLGDWMTTRSHVFTVYGTVRGSLDFNGDGRIDNSEGPRMDELDRRAIRFQETMDRFPVLMGRSRPGRIGNRVVASYANAFDN